MARFSAEIRATLVGRQAPAKVLEYLNQDFYEIREGNIFITCALGILYPARHRLELALAGHPPPLIIDRKGRPRAVDDKAGGLPLGLFAEAASPLPYQIQELEIARGDTLVFYTDGIIEAMSATGEQYGVERLESVLSDPRPSVEALSASILEDIERFCQGKRPVDDTTLVCLRRQG
jgi:serine phosphatase RsbU (regulator of sigma subunit)